MDEQAKALARYRLEKAQQVLQSADMQKGLLRLWKPI